MSGEPTPTVCVYIHFLYERRTCSKFHVLLNLALLLDTLVLMTNGMTTDVYHRNNCIAPDIAFIYYGPRTQRESARARARVALGRDGRMIDLHLPSGFLTPPPPYPTIRLNSQVDTLVR